MKNYLEFEKEIKTLETDLESLKSPFGSEGITEVDTQKIIKTEEEINQIQNLHWQKHLVLNNQKDTIGHYFQTYNWLSCSNHRSKDISLQILCQRFLTKGQHKFVVLKSLQNLLRFQIISISKLLKMIAQQKNY